MTKPEPVTLCRYCRGVVEAFTAHCPGYCPACSERIEVGDRITLASDDGAWVCHDCATEGTRLDHARGKREEPVCSTCWLVHPEGACDR